MNARIAPSLPPAQILGDLDQQSNVMRHGTADNVPTPAAAGSPQDEYQPQRHAQGSGQRHAQHGFLSVIAARIK